MNKRRRMKLVAAKSNLIEVRDAVNAIIEEEDESRENMPESLQESDRYIESAECSEVMTSAVDYIDEAISALDEVVL